MDACLQADSLLLLTCVGTLRTTQGQRQCQHLTQTLDCSAHLKCFQFRCSVVSHSATPWTAARQASLSTTSSRSLLKLMSLESVMPSNHLILCRPLLLLPPVPPSIRVFSNESTLRMRWPKYWSFSFSIIPSKEIPGLISFRMDWLDLLAPTPQLKASILQCSAFFHSPTLTSIHDCWKNHSLD